RLDYRQCRKRSTTILAVELCCALEKAAVEVEDITRVCLTTWRTAQQQRDLTVGSSLLRKVVVHRQGVTSRIAKVLTHRRTGVGSDKLKWSRVGCACNDDGGVLHRPVLLERPDNVGDGRGLLSDGDVEAVNRVNPEFLRLRRVRVLLVDDRVDRHGRLAGLAVADDQLTLSPSDRDHRIDSLQTCLKRFGHRIANDNARGLAFDGMRVFGFDRTTAVVRNSQRVYDA